MGYFDKLTVAQLFKVNSTFYETQNSIAVLTTVRRGVYPDPQAFSPCLPHLFS